MWIPLVGVTDLYRVLGLICPQWGDYPTVDTTSVNVVIYIGVIATT